MKRLIIPVLALFLALAAVAVYFSSDAAGNKKLKSQVQLREGDLVFQSLDSDLSAAIELATHSRYSHCGIVYKEGDQWFVYEALQPVQLTPFAEWTARGKGGHYAVRRLKDAGTLTSETLKKMKAWGLAQKGKDYDIYFNWSDERMYCSELVWKMYKEATSIELGSLQKLREFDLSSPQVKKKLAEHYGTNIPLEEPVISPISVFNSDLLETVPN